MGAGRHIGTMVSLLKNRSPSQCHIVLVLNRLPKPGICAFQLIIWWKFMIIKYLWGTINILRTLNKLKSWRTQDGRDGILPGLWLTSGRCMECWCSTGPLPNWRQSLLSTYIWIFSLTPFVFSQFIAEASVGEKWKQNLIAEQVTFPMMEPVFTECVTGASMLYLSELLKAQGGGFGKNGIIKIYQKGIFFFFFCKLHMIQMSGSWPAAWL